MTEKVKAGRNRTLVVSEAEKKVLAEKLKQQLITEITNEYSKLPQFKTDNTLGDYKKVFENHLTETDVKTKIMILNSNPKAYNIDKFLKFLCEDNTVFLFYFIGIDTTKIVNQVLVSVFQKDLLQSTIALKHWAGRNSRGVTQFIGATIHDLIIKPRNYIDEKLAIKYLSELILL